MFQSTFTHGSSEPDELILHRGLADELEVAERVEAGVGEIHIVDRQVGDECMGRGRDGADLVAAVDGRLGVDRLGDVEPADDIAEAAA